MTLVVKVRRYDPAVDQSAYFDTFEVPIAPQGQWTVLDVLDYIHFHLDSSLSYYRHSACNRGVCARCAAQINGKAGLVCEYIVPLEGELVLEPAPGKSIVKDLVGK
jgi:succinate dehydrogenase/fumarate reductase-like Fe-S protein